VVWTRLRLAAELRCWRRAGRQARLWWRDDDARGPSPALDRLLTLSDQRRTPLTLAVVPDHRLTALAPTLAARPWVCVAQHGVDHRNRRQGPAAGEFPPEWRDEQITQAIAAGWRQLVGLPGLRPLFVPPWNDVHPDLPSALRRRGFAGLSAWGEVGPAFGSLRLDAHIDLMRWRKGPRFRGAARVRAALAEALRHRRLAGLWDAPIGLLTHHLDHDAAAWAFLDAFLIWSGRRPELVWVSLAELLPGPMEATSTAA
jgi:hypothetical protein